jgi:hypothetical protein
MLDRRNFLKSAASVGALGVGAIPATADPFALSDHGDWRTYEIRTVVEIDSAEPVRIWAPAAAFDAPDWSRPLGTNWTGNADSAEIVRDPGYGAEFVHLDWRAGSGGRWAEIVSRVATRDRAVDVRAGKGDAALLSPDERALFTKATALIPTDGIVKQTSDKIVAGATSDLEKARAIYAWLVVNTERIAATRGCGSGDITAMLAEESLAANAPTSTACSSASFARRVFRRATSMAFASPLRASATRASASLRPTSPRPSIAGPTSGSRGLAGRRWTQPTSERSCSRSRPLI